MWPVWSTGPHTLGLMPCWQCPEVLNTLCSLGTRACTWTGPSSSPTGAGVGIAQDHLSLSLTPSLAFFLDKGQWSGSPHSENPQISHPGLSPSFWCQWCARFPRKLCWVENNDDPLHERLSLIDTIFPRRKESFPFHSHTSVLNFHYNTEICSTLNHSRCFSVSLSLTSLGVSRTRTTTSSFLCPSIISAMLLVRVTTITNIYFPCALLQTLLWALCKLLRPLNKYKAECIMSHSADEKSKG